MIDIFLISENPEISHSDTIVSLFLFLHITLVSMIIEIITIPIINTLSSI